MNIVQIVQRMERAGITLKLKDQKLQVLRDTPLSEAQRTFVKEHRDELIHYLHMIDDPNIQEMKNLFGATIQSIYPNDSVSI